MEQATVEAGARVPQRALRKAGANVNRAERWLSALGGSTLVALGVRRRGVPGVLLAAMGGVLFKRGTSGQSRLYRALGLTSLERAPAAPRGEAAAPRIGAGEAIRRVERSVTVNRTPEVIFALLADPERLRGVLGEEVRVELLGEGRARWIAPGGAAWEGEPVEVREGARIAWRSLREEASIQSCAVDLEPAPGTRGTVVRVTLEHTPIGGGLGLGLAKLVGEDPDQVVRGALRRLKQAVEAGEISTIEGQTSCRRNQGS